MSESLLSLFARRHGIAPESIAPLKSLALWHREVRMHGDLVAEGDKPAEAYFVVEGFASRYNLMPEGRRATVGFLLPGDFCGSYLELGGSFDHGIGALTHCVIACVPATDLFAKMRESETLRLSLARALIIEAAIQRRWLGCMSSGADRRVAHLLCELHARLSLVGLADDDSFPLPITQQDAGEATGISAVHMNRTMQRLKELRLIRTSEHRVFFPSLTKMRKFANFDPSYLLINEGSFALSLQK